jgi:hypothetical protein
MYNFNASALPFLIRDDEKKNRFLPFLTSGIAGQF